MSKKFLAIAIIALVCNSAIIGQGHARNPLPDGHLCSPGGSHLLIKKQNCDNQCLALQKTPTKEYQSNIYPSQCASGVSCGCK